MALSAEQKAANKEKRLARDRAYRARYNEWRDARTAAAAPFPRRPEEQDPKVTPDAVVLAAWAADARFDAAFEAVRQEEETIRDQIAQLEESLKGVRNRHNTSELAKVRSAAYDALNAARKTAGDAVDAQFADVAHAHSAAAWGAKVGFDADAE
ncbi:hypothetical protein [Burkholderia ubonensis]|uniref:hypothetical protein n=1 Tax=Burkholderia ubonensis TaxID=101571 RepID=UPI00075578BE|nr:hypothetical protein [Burkholderia ubonensis]